MTILFSPSLNTEFDTNVTPLDQIPTDAFTPQVDIKIKEIQAEIQALETQEAVEVQADILTKSKKG